MKQLWQLILWQRTKDYIKKYQPKIVGVAGSTGKTLAKDAIDTALRDSYRVRSTPGSDNTRLGVALAILGLTEVKSPRSWFGLLARSKARELTDVEPELLVLELGANKPGDIDYLAGKILFTIGVVTNVQSTHLELFMNKDLVAHELTSLVTAVPENGTVVLNADDPRVKAMANKSAGRVVTFGQADEADIRMVWRKRMASFGFACEISVAGKRHELHLPQIVAEYQLNHILAALAVAHVLRVDMNKAVVNLQSIVPPPGRMRLLRGAAGARLLDDSYNASPESMLAALELLRELPARRKIAILGDMLDLGAQTIDWHRQVGEKARETAHVLVTVGDYMRQAGAVALAKGGVDVHHFDWSQDVGKWWRDFLREDDLVLIKGSRATQMERVVARLYDGGK